MILKRLYEFTQNVKDNIPPRGTELKEIPYIIVIDTNGKFKRFESKRIDKHKSVTFIVPKAVAHRNTPKPNTLWDNGKYVLGFEIEDGEYKDSFIKIIRKISELHKDEVSIQALSRFYDVPAEETIRLMESDPLYNEVVGSYSSNFSFKLDGDDEIIAEKIYLIEGLSPEVTEKEVFGRCLVTGLYGPLVRTSTPTPLPGNTASAALVSFQVNSGYDSYGIKQAFNAPISADAEWAVTTALKYMSRKDSRNKARIGKRIFLFWNGGSVAEKDDVTECFAFLLDIPAKSVQNPNDNVEKFTKLIKSIFSGKIRTSLDDRFYILGLAPNLGRIAVVLWVDCQLKEFAEKILSHFEDMEIVDTRKEESRKPYVGVYSMISAVTRKKRQQPKALKQNKQESDSCSVKLSGVMPNLPEYVTEAVINGTPYPVSLYMGALERIRQELSNSNDNWQQTHKREEKFKRVHKEHSDSAVTIQRAAILKAYINRKEKFNNKHKKLTIMLDKSNKNSGYLCGRLAAVLVRIQEEAKSGDSIRTRYMASASSTPATVFPAMLNVSVHHSEKLNDSSRIFFEQLKQEIIDKMPVEGFPAHLDLSDQGRFFVGYYHQCAEFYTKKDKKD